MNEYRYIRLGDEWVIGMVEDSNPYQLFIPYSVIVVESSEDGNPTVITLAPFDPCNSNSIVDIRSRHITASAKPSESLITAYNNAIKPEAEDKIDVVHH